MNKVAERPRFLEPGHGFNEFEYRARMADAVEVKTSKRMASMGKENRNVGDIMLMLLKRAKCSKD